MNLHDTALAAEVLRPGDDGYDEAARVFFATGQPALVVRPATRTRSPRRCGTPPATTWPCRCAPAATARSATARTPAGW